MGRAKKLTKEYTLYEIVSPEGNVYTGYTGSDVEERWLRHISNYKHSRESKLFNSFDTHGVDKHEFRVIKEGVVNKDYVKIMEDDKIKMQRGLGKSLNLANAYKNNGR